MMTLRIIIIKLVLYQVNIINNANFTNVVKQSFYILMRSHRCETKLYQYIEKGGVSGIVKVCG